MLTTKTQKIVDLFVSSDFKDMNEILKNAKNSKELVF